VIASIARLSLDDERGQRTGSFRLEGEGFLDPRTRTTNVITVKPAAMAGAGVAPGSIIEVVRRGI
jgi:hypothetical protein